MRTLAARALAASACALALAAPVVAARPAEDAAVDAVPYQPASRPLPATAPSGEALYRDYVENPRNTGEGQATPHVLLRPYADADAALRGGDDGPWMRSLDGEWRLRMADLPEHAPAGFWRDGFDLSSWPTARVPHTLQADGFDHPMFRNVAEELWPDDPPKVPRDLNPTAAYARDFELPADWSGREVLLRFEGATSAYFVWINGRYAGYDQGGYAPAEFDISAFVRPGRNRIAVQLHRWSAGSYLEDYDQWRYSGIFRSVGLYAVPKARIRDAWIDAVPGAEDGDGRLQARLSIAREAGASVGGYRVRATVHDGGGREVAHGETAVVPAPAESEASLALAVPDAAPWTDETPTLYTLVLALLAPDGSQVHATRQEVGFRAVAVRDGQLQVNGRRILVKGVNRAETDPDHGRHVPRERQQQDMALLKRLHFNAVRTSHYPSDPYFYALADRHGLWLVDEVDAETHAHDQCPDRCLADRPEWQDAFLERFAAMVARDRNHPSVLLWDTGNEAGLGRAHQAMAAWAARHEPTRPLYHQSNAPDGDAPFAQVRGPRYPSLQRLEQIARGGGAAGDTHGADPAKPVILGEYAHAMGNSLGNFAELWRTIRAHLQLQGGFVWDWAEQTLRQPLRIAHDGGPHRIAVWLVGAPAEVPGVIVDGRQGRALAFSGLDDFVELYRDPALDLGGEAITLDAWVKPARPWRDFTVLSKGDAQYALKMRDERTLRFVLRLDGAPAVLDATVPDTLWHAGDPARGIATRPHARTALPAAHRPAPGRTRILRPAGLVRTPRRELRRPTPGLADRRVGGEGRRPVRGLPRAAGQRQPHRRALGRARRRPRRRPAGGRRRRRGRGPLRRARPRRLRLRARAQRRLDHAARQPSPQRRRRHAPPGAAGVPRRRRPRPRLGPGAAPAVGGRGAQRPARGRRGVAMTAAAPRIDAHVHAWRYAPAEYPWIDAGMDALRRDRLPDDLAPLLAKAGLDACIAVQARADEAENAFLLDLADAHAWIAAVVGWVDLFAADAGERIAHWAARPKLRGIRHLLQDDPDVAATLADPRFAAGVRAVQARGLVYEVLVRGPAQLAQVPAFCARHDAHALVLDHLGKPAIGGTGETEWREALHALAAQPHVLCKLSGLVTEVVTAQLDRDALHRHLDAALDAFGPDRLMFGSDWPVCLLRAGHAEVAALVRDWAARLSPDEQAGVWGGTAGRCYGLHA